MTRCGIPLRVLVAPVLAAVAALTFVHMRSVSADESYQWDLPPDFPSPTFLPTIP